MWEVKSISWVKCFRLCGQSRPQSDTSFISSGETGKCQGPGQEGMEISAVETVTLELSKDWERVAERGVGAVRCVGEEVRRGGGGDWDRGGGGGGGGGETVAAMMK